MLVLVHLPDAGPCDRCICLMLILTTCALPIAYNTPTSLLLSTPHHVYCPSAVQGARQRRARPAVPGRPSRLRPQCCPPAPPAPHPHLASASCPAAPCSSCCTADSGPCAAGCAARTRGAEAGRGSNCQPSCPQHTPPRCHWGWAHWGPGI